MSKTIYGVGSGNCEDGDQSVGPIVFSTKAKAIAVAKEITEELFSELQGDEPGKYYVERRDGDDSPGDGPCFCIVQSKDHLTCNWWYVKKMELK